MIFYFGRKQPQYYKGLLIKADLGLHDEIAAHVLSAIPLGSKILDMGAGEGALSARLSDMGYRVTAADKDPQGFRCKAAEFVCLDFDSARDIDAFVDSRENTFDAVLGVEVIEHVQDQWQYVRQLTKLAKPGGLILVTTPNTTSWLSRLKFLLTGRFHQFDDEDLSYGHINPLSSWELELILRSIGLKDHRVLPAGTLPPVYLTGSLKILILNLAALFIRPFSSGMLDGWCIIGTGRKPE